MTVAALLVSHDGARWLPAVLTGLRDQTHPLDRVVAVDTGSRDGSVEMLLDELGQAAVVPARAGTGFGEAVRLGLAELGPPAAADDWVWLLHDDANPAPTALAELLHAADENPDAAILGPKLREWPSLRRLLEIGVTLSGTGRRETGLERGEYDQGQHDEVRRVLAVNTAGMLVRRRVLEELDGFDPNLPIFGNDLDFGWRAAAAGHTTVAVPQAVVFHAEAAHRGTRRTALTGQHTHFQERRAALYTLLANTSSRSLLLQTVRLGLGSLLRALGFLLVRAVGEALDELAALGSIYLRPGLIRRARRQRRAHQVADPRGVRALLAPRWLPYRHGLDFVGDLVSATFRQAQDVAERRRAAKLEAELVEAGGGAAPARRHHVEDEDELPEDTGLVVRFLTNPVALATAVFLVAALVGARSALGRVSGGALPPAPETDAVWWRLLADSWHPIGQGSEVPAPPYVAPMALLSTLLPGGPATAVSLVLVLAVPMAFWGAWRFLRVAGHLVSARGAGRWLLLWGSATYALVPATSGAWGEGRLGTVVVAALLPWLAHAALGFADPEPDRRWRAGWRTGLLLALATAFAPTLWPAAVLLAAVVAGLALLLSPQGVRRRSVLGPPVAALLVPPVLLVPWVLPLLLHGPRSGLLLGPGRLPGESLGPTDVLAGHAATSGAPAALGVALLALGVLALAPAASRVLVLVCWIVAATAAAGLAAMSRVTIPAVAGSAWPALGVFVVVLLGAAVTAVVLAEPELWRGRLGRLRRAARAVVAAGLAVLPAAGLVWFVAGGHDSFTRVAADEVPAYMAQSSMLGPEHGVLLLDGSIESGLRYAVRRDDGLTLGENEIAALTPESTRLTEEVQALVTRPSTPVVRSLADRGIEYILLQAPVDGRVAATLDAAGDLDQASAENRRTRAWRIARGPTPGALDGPESRLRPVLLAVQGVVGVVVLVLCVPSRRRAR